MNPLFASLLHSLWQAGLIWLGAFAAFRLIPAWRPGLRYKVALGSVVLVMVAWFSTWTLLDNRPDPRRVVAAVQTFSNEAVVSAPGVIQQGTTASAALAVPVRARVPWQSWLVWIWKAGVAVGFLRIASSLHASRKFAAGAETVVDPRWLRELDRVRGEYGTRISIRLQTCADVISPVVIGWFRPVILLPASALIGIPPEALRAVLAHEVAHVARWDFLVNLMQMGAEALLFFNPFVWSLNEMARREREACCDAMASGVCSGPAGYAEALVWWTRASGGGVGGAALAMAPEGGHWLRDRVLRLLNPAHIPVTPKGWLGAGGAACFVALFFLLVAHGVQFTVKELTARERVELIRRLAAPFKDPWTVPTPAAHASERPFSGTIVDEAGNPIAGAEWWMMPPRNSKFVDGIRGKTGPDGRFGGVLPNELLRFYVEAKEFAPAAEKYELGAPTQNVKLTLKRGIDFAVLCVDPAGKPVPGVEVSISYGALMCRLRRAVADGQGLAQFHHQPEGLLGEITFSKAGYQTVRTENVAVNARPEPFRFSLKKAEPFHLAVVDELDGSPVSGVTIRAEERWPETAPFAWPQWNGAGMRTDANGNVDLEGLDPELTYGLFAEYKQGPRRGTLFRISPGKENSLTLKLPRERRLKLKIVNLDIPEKELTIEYGQALGTHSSEANHVKLPVVNGVVETELRGLRPDWVNVYVLGQWSRIPELKSEASEFTIDYAKIKPPEKARVILNLNVGRGSAAPAGSFWINWKLPGQTTSSSGTSVLIKEGRAEFELPSTALFRLNNSQLLGGRVDEQKEYQVTSNPTVLTVPVKAAGLIRVKVLEKDGSLAQAVFVQAHSGSDLSEGWVEIKNISSQGDSRDWYVSNPVEFGWSRYRVLASHGNRFVISDSFMIRAGTPVKELVLTLPEAVRREIQVVDEQGQPARGVGLTTRCELEGWGSVAGDSAQADANGRATLWMGRGTPEGKFSVTPENGGFLRDKVYVAFSGGEPVKVVLQKGKRVAGRIVDASTGAGVPGIRISWTVWRQTETGNRSVSTQIMGSPEYTTDTSGRFEFTNGPAEEVFLMVHYPLGKQIRGASNSLKLVPGGEEAVLYLEDAPSRR